MTEVPIAPAPLKLIGLWRRLMRLTRKHGLFTLARWHARMFSQGQFISLPGTARMYVPPDPHFFGFVLGEHEPHVTELFLRHVKRGACCMDVGANIGYFSSILASVAGSSGEVLAYEPIPENYATLKINAAVAAQSGFNLKCFNAAVSATPGQLRIVRRQWSTYHEVAPCDNTMPAGAELIPAVTVDDEIGKLPANRNIQMIKIDVEGHELPVVMGLRKSVAAKRIERLVIEVTPGADAATIDDILSDASQIQCWVNGEWKEQKIASLTERTDVFVDYTAK